MFEQKKFDKAKFKFEQEIVFNPKSEQSYLYLAKIFKLKKNDNLLERNLICCDGASSPDNCFECINK